MEGSIIYPLEHLRYSSSRVEVVLKHSFLFFSGVGLCSGIADGNYRDHDNCYRYISCVDQIAQRYSCGSLKFNEKIGSCDIGNNVECGQGRFS